MIYDKNSRSWGDGQWHCPFPREWVEKMRKTVKRFESLNDELIKESCERMKYGFDLPLPLENYLEQPQDSRGMPLSWCEEEERMYGNHPVSCCATYDYRSIPETVITNGEDDWPLTIWTKILNA